MMVVVAAIVMIIMMMMIMMMMMEAKKRTKISTITKRSFLRERKTSQFSSVSNIVLL
jgi:ABC-type uncharacterized transport system permease subunit